MTSVNSSSGSSSRGGVGGVKPNGDANVFSDGSGGDVSSPASSPVMKRRRINSGEYRSAIPEKARDLLRGLVIGDAQLERMILTFEYEMNMGLSAHAENQNFSSLIMAPTYVRDLINGTEKGQFLAMDLGGTNFRILLVTLEKGRKCTKVSQMFNVPTAALTGSSSKLYDHLAESIEKFIQDQNLGNKRLPLGFTFSFPMTQTDLASASLVQWTKSFQCTDGVGEDPVRLLEEAIKRRQETTGQKVNVHTVAILNDTTGTLMAGNFQDPNCQIGLILGTGSNVCYMEDLDRVGKWQEEHEDPKQVVINVEWGAFGDNGSLEYMRTEFDREVDKQSAHVGSYSFEKLFSGMYMGEVVRQIMIKLTKENLLFDGTMPSAFAETYSFPTKYVSLIEGDAEPGHPHVRSLFEAQDVKVSQSDVDLIVYMCHLVSVRAAKVVAVALSAIVKRLNKASTTIAVDGSLFKYHPNLRGVMEDILEAWCPDTQCSFVLAEDGSGRGAAFVAAVGMRLRREICGKIKQLGWKSAYGNYCKF